MGKPMRSPKDDFMLTARRVERVLDRPIDVVDYSVGQGDGVPQPVRWIPPGWKSIRNSLAITYGDRIDIR